MEDKEKDKLLDEVHAYLDQAIIEDKELSKRIHELTRSLASYVIYSMLPPICHEFKKMLETGDDLPTALHKSILASLTYLETGRLIQFSEKAMINVIDDEH